MKFINTFCIHHNNERHNNDTDDVDFYCSFYMSSNNKNPENI